MSERLPEHLWARLCGPESAPQDDHARFALIVRRVLGLGLPTWVLERRFDATRQALFGFTPSAVAALDEEGIEGYLGQPGVLPNRRKVMAVVHNARVVMAVAATHGDFGTFAESLVDAAGEPRGSALLAYLEREFELIGPVSAARVAQELGHDVLVPHPAVLRLLQRIGAVPRGAAARQKAQALSESVAPPVWGPRRRTRLGAMLLAFSTGRWRADGVCLDEPACGECPVQDTCPREGLGELAACAQAVAVLGV